jgi:exo-beta-1,3-glucanase (GH17 family)
MSLRRAAVVIPAMLFVTFFWWWPNRATTEAFPTGRLDAVSFAPFRPGQSPLTGIYPTTAQMAQDIALLAPHVRAIRTYAAFGSQGEAASLARAQGLKVWQGIWLGDNPADNAREIAAGIALANRYPDVIDRVIVGNEVLLRHDLTTAALIADIEQMRARVRQPVAYADVWQDWQRFPQVAAHVDQVMVHLLPFWEDQPLPIGAAVAQELDYYRRIQALFPGKTVVVGEAGWPSAGRWRQGAAPGRVNEARFLRAFTDAASRQGIEYNIIEAFDQDWKAAQEGTVGAAWGIWTADRQPKFPAGLPVRDDPAWAWHAGASILLGAVLLAVRRLGGGRRLEPADVLLGMALGTALVWAWVETLAAAFGVDRQMAALLNLLGQSALAWLLLVRPRHARLLGWLGWAFLLAALYLQIWLLVDPRYRDFPTAAFAVPLVGAAWRLLARTDAAGNRLEALAAIALAAAALAGAAQEGMENRQSLAWCAAALLLAAPPLFCLARALMPGAARAALPGERSGG